MTKTRVSIAVVVLAAALSACGGTAAPAAPVETPPSSATAPAAKPDTAAEKAAVEAVFRGYYEALLARDFSTACTLNAPETQAKLVENVKAGGGAVATCEEAFSAIYAVPGAGEAADEIARTTEIKEITINGDAATITWTATFQGQTPTVSNGARKIDGEWRLLDTSA